MQRGAAGAGGDSAPAVSAAAGAARVAARRGAGWRIKSECSPRTPLNPKTSAGRHGEDGDFCHGGVGGASGAVEQRPRLLPAFLQLQQLHQLGIQETPFAQLPQLAPVPGVGGAAAALYQSMQLVPCLCSVPKEDVDDAAAAGNSVAVNAASAPPQPGHGN
ncbi:Protein of unknown function [Gryllus bimaculatus]|nr:Protein of unknown function [Gryllus bimaculatus]